MKGSECRLLIYMSGSQKRFVIPVYQRTYNWKEEQCRQLYNDLVKIIKNGRKSHFFGSIVSCYNTDSAKEEYLIIDGQQRLTTVSLLLLAMYHLITKKILVPEDTMLAEKILEEYLTDKYDVGDTRIKLRPIKKDRSAFRALFDTEAEPVKHSDLTCNYTYFYERIQKQELTLDELFEAIRRLEIIHIKLNHEDDPQLIFESLNSTGLDLNEGDKVRNYILMGLTAEEQTFYYESFWEPVEKAVKNEVSAFIRDYLSVRQKAIPSQKRIYSAFKDFAEKEYTKNSVVQTQALLEDLKRYAKRYHLLLGGDTKSETLNACIRRLNRLETTVTRPFFLEVLRLCDEGKLMLSEAETIFLTTESYLFRRIICDLPANALNKFFLTLHDKIISLDGTEKDYVKKFNYVLLSKKERLRFPDDREFSAEFTNRPVYSMQSKNKLYLFERLENADTKEDKDIYRHCDNGTYTIEHIMPQHLTPEWQEALGENYAEIHDTWLHRIANLTLTAYNSEYSNASFLKKKTMENGFLHSGIRLNAFPAQKEKWTLEELKERNEWMKKRALLIWKFPVSDYQPPVPQSDSLTLEDDPALLTGKKLSSFCYKTAEYPVKNWKALFQTVLQMLYEENKAVFAALAEAEQGGLSDSFRITAEGLRAPVKIEDGIFAETNYSTQQKLLLLQKLFRYCDADPADLIFYLKDSAKPESEQLDPSRERYLKYWALVLAETEKDPENTAYHGKKPTTDNWLNGQIPFSGCYICCIATQKQARVELQILKGSIEKTKALFDGLYAQKETIEQSVGAPLLWQRNSKDPRSKIYCELNGVSVAKETDQKQMAAFHAEWSKKFYHAFVSALKNLS